MGEQTRNKTNFKDAFNSFTQKMSEFVRRDKSKSAGRKIASSLWSLTFGIIISLIYVMIKVPVTGGVAVNPLEVFTVIFKGFNAGNQRFIINFFLVFGFSSLACAISFKAGIFNIGIPGQMMATGFTSFGLFIYWGYDKHFSVTVPHILLALLLSVLFAALLGAIAGILKTALNVHEVITTIMLNWIIVGISMAIFQRSSASVFWSQLSDTQLDHYFSKELQGVNAGAILISESVKELFNILGIIFLLLAVFVGFFIFNFTALGYKINMLGISKTNGKYMGVDDKFLTIMILAASGAISGIAGFYQYVIAPSPSYSSITGPLNIGFESIAISLLALNSPIGILFSSLFYTAIYNSQFGLQGLFIKYEDTQVATSLILYLAATSLMFLNFKPIYFIRQKIYLNRDPRTDANKKLLKYELKAHRLTRAYELKMHNLKYNANSKNQESFLQKMNILETKHQKAIYLNNLRIEWAKKLVLEAEKTHKLCLKLHQANLKNDLEAKAIIKQAIKEANKNYVQLNKFEYDQTLLNQLPAIEHKLIVEELSNKAKVKNLKVQLKKMTDQYLSKAMNFKNTDLETIQLFEKINNEKLELLNEMKALGSANKFNIMQQYIASVKNTQNHFNTLFIASIEEQKQMHKELILAKKEMKAINKQAKMKEAN